MTRVTCPKCNHTFDVNDSEYNLQNHGHVWIKYSNPQGFKRECDWCHELFDEVYVYYCKQDYYEHTPQAFCMTQPRPRIFCKNCTSKVLSPEQLYELEKDGYIVR